MKKICIILPAYNEAKMIGGVIDDLLRYLDSLKNLTAEIVVVDDGSRDQTALIVKKKGINVIKHIVNRGLGGALATGLEYARRQNVDIALTMDSDGQHSCEDIETAITPLLSGDYDVIIGSRMLGQDGMPLDRKVLNALSNVATWLLFGVWTTDSQSGFRAFNQKALEQIRIKTQGMEVSSEFFTEIKANKLRYGEVPIKVIYSSYSRKKGQTNLNSINIMAKLLLRLFR